MADSSDGAAPPAKRRGPGRPWPKGQSGNPGGRRSSQYIRDFLAEILDGTDTTKRRAMLEELYRTALNGRHRDHVRAVELLMGYDAGKPTAAVEVSGPGGGPLDFGDVSRMTTEEKRRQLAYFAARARGEDVPPPPGLEPFDDSDDDENDDHLIPG